MNEEWTLRDMMQHAEKKGLKFKWRNDGNNRITVEFPKQPPKVDPESAFAELIEPSGYYSDYAWNMRISTRGLSPPYDVVIQKRDTAKEARELAGSSQTGQSWGRFQFSGSADRIKQIMDKLPK